MIAEKKLDNSTSLERYATNFRVFTAGIVLFPVFGILRSCSLAGGYQSFQETSYFWKLLSSYNVNLFQNPQDHKQVKEYLILGQYCSLHPYRWNHALILSFNIHVFFQNGKSLEGTGLRIQGNCDFTDSSRWISH